MPRQLSREAKSLLMPAMPAKPPPDGTGDIITIDCSCQSKDTVDKLVGRLDEEARQATDTGDISRCFRVVVPQCAEGEPVDVYRVYFIAETFQGGRYADEFGWDFSRGVQKLARRGKWDKTKWRLQTGSRQESDPDKAMKAELRLGEKMMEVFPGEDARLDWFP